MLNTQVAVCPQASLAVQVTVVVPTGKVLPEGGLQTTVTGGQPPLVVGAKFTIAPAGPLAVMTLFDGQVIASAGEGVATMRMVPVVEPDMPPT